MILVCQVTPKARRSECAGWTSDERGRRVLRVKLAAAPVDGKANEELVRLLADPPGYAKGGIVVARGGSGRVKTLYIPDAAAGCLPES